MQLHPRTSTPSSICKGKSSLLSYTLRMWGSQHEEHQTKKGYWKILDIHNWQAFITLFYPWWEFYPSFNVQFLDLYPLVCILSLSSLPCSFQLPGTHLILQMLSGPWSPRRIHTLVPPVEKSKEENSRQRPEGDSGPDATFWLTCCATEWGMGLPMPEGHLCTAPLRDQPPYQGRTRRLELLWE